MRSVTCTWWRRPSLTRSQTSASRRASSGEGLQHGPWARGRGHGGSAFEGVLDARGIDGLLSQGLGDAALCQEGQEQVLRPYRPMAALQGYLVGPGPEWMSLPR